MIFQETFLLSNGVRIPKLGFGTWRLEGETAYRSAADALALGYRLIDTAQAYENEREIGLAVKKSGVPREEIFVTTKLRAEFKTYERAKRAIDESLRALDVGYIDCMLIHAPQPWADFRGGDYSEGNRQAWRALEEAYEEGKLKSIGVANFELADLDALSSSARILPQINQILCHIGNTPLSLIEACRRRNILVEAYSPIAHGVALGNSAILAAAEKYGVTAAQLCVRYDLQLGTVPLPKAASCAHMQNNCDVNFTISEEDMAALKAERIDTYGEFDAFLCFGKGIAK